MEENKEDVMAFGVRLPTGSVLPVKAHKRLTAGALLARLVAECGLPPAAQDSLGLSLGYIALNLSASLRENDVLAGDTITLFPRSRSP
jgi:hypothetical protein